MSASIEHHQKPHSLAMGYGYNDWSSAVSGGSSSSSYEAKGDSWFSNSSSSLLGSFQTSLTLPHLRHHHHSRNHGSNRTTSPLRFPNTNNMFSLKGSSGNSDSAFAHTTSDSYLSDVSKESSSASGGGTLGENETFLVKSFLSSEQSSSSTLSQSSSTSRWASVATNKSDNLEDIATQINYNGILSKLDRFGRKIERSTRGSGLSMTHFNMTSHHQQHPHNHHPANKSFASSALASIEPFVNNSSGNDGENADSFGKYGNHSLSLDGFDGTEDFQTVEDISTTSYNYNSSSVIDINETMRNATNATSSFQGNLYASILPVMLFFCVLAVLVNLLIVISARWCRKPMSPTLYFSISLALADAYAAVVLAVGLVINSLLPVVFQYEGVPMCFKLTVEAFRQGGILVLVCHLLALAMNHWIGIVRPLHYAATMTRRTAWTVIIFSWICPITMIFIYYSSVRGEGFQSPGCKNYDFLLERTYRAFFASCFFAPLVLMSFIYIHIFIIVRNHHTHRQRYQSSQQLKRNVKAVLTTMLVLGTYIIGWMPATLFSLIACKNCVYNIKSLSEIVRFSFGITTNLLVILKTLVDPIIYAARMSDIQMALKKMRYDIMSKFCKSCAPAAPPNDRGYYLNSPSNRTSFYDTKSMRMSSFGSRSNSTRRMNNTTANASVRLNSNQMNQSNHPQSHKQPVPHNGMMMTGPSNGYIPCATEILSHPNSNGSSRRSFARNAQPQPLINNKSSFEMTEIN